MNKLEEVYVGNDYADEDIPDVDTSEYLTMNEKPAAELSVPPSPCPVPPPDDVMLPGSLCPSQGPSNLPRRCRWNPPPRKRHPVDELGRCSRYSCGNIRCWWTRTFIGAGQNRHTSDVNSLITSLKKRSTQLVPYGTSAFTANCPRSWPRISATRLWRSDSNYCRSGRVGGAAASTAPSVSLRPAMCAASKRFHDAEEQSSRSFCNESWGTF